MLGHARLIWHIGKAEGANIRPAKGSSLIGQEQGQLPQADTVTNINISNCHHFLQSIKKQPKKTPVLFQTLKRK